MKTRHLLASVAGIAALSVSTGAADRFTETRARIDSLLGARLKPAGLPDEISNPFATGSGRPPPAQDVKPGQTPRVESDETVLVRFASQLRIGGVIHIGDRPHLVLNQTPYKEGDLIQLRNSEPPEYVRLTGITMREFTLTYRGTSVKVPIPN
jgi:hypothetical protein